MAGLKMETPYEVLTEEQEDEIKMEPELLRRAEVYINDNYTFVGEVGGTKTNKDSEAFK